ncbi:MAG: GNAT family N-acetyltransferase [Oscillospiraceae bacterium]|jgi:RimJ/RimL family protein N-acetyltransferase|nr:GNAT family N-acetyltransferase [Oscillospiraceae bacterium]
MSNRIVLDSPRLLLREWQDEDLPDLLEGLNNLEISRWLARIPYPLTEEAGRRFIARCRAAARENPRCDYEFAIERKAGGNVIGCVGLSGIDRFNGTAGGGIWINAAYHGYGYGREAFDARIRFAFETLGLRRLENGFLAGNEASRRMQESLGYRIEGTRRQGFRCAADGQYKDEVVTGLLREEWKPMGQESLYDSQRRISE